MDKYTEKPFNNNIAVGSDRSCAVVCGKRIQGTPPQHTHRR
jgi:hypothetical protein